MQCNKCTLNFSDLNLYFVHIGEVHGMSGNDNFRCTLCNEILKNFTRFKKHVGTCFEKYNVLDETEQLGQAAFLETFNDAEMEDQNITVFRSKMKNSALHLVSRMSANMDTSRSLVFETISHFQEFIGAVIDGMNTIIFPRVLDSEKYTVKDFIDVVESSFANVNTEHNFEKELERAGLIHNFEKCAMFKDDEIDEEAGTELILMPIAFQIKKFLELPDVLEKIRKNTIEIQRQNKLSNFINGSLWKDKLKNYKTDDFVIPYHFYVDAAQINHPLGPHCVKGSEEFNYYSFPTIPTEYMSRLENIFVAALFPEKYFKTYTMSNVYGNIVEELTKLAHEGLNVNVNGIDEKIFFVCGLFIGDNKEANTILCFIRGFNANYYCRFCRLNKGQMQHATVEFPENRRNRLNYEADVLMHDQRATGVREYAPLNYLPHFHVTDSSTEDITHNVDGGVCHYNFLECMNYFIYEKQYFALDMLNERMRSFPYAEDEKSNIPQPILEANFEKSKFKMTISEMANFTQNITLMIGDLVPETDIVWHFLLSTVKFYDMCYLPCYEDQDIEEWREVIDEMLTYYQHVFEYNLKPVHHMSILYPDDTKKFGPLRYTRTIRFEGKHKEIKAYANNTNNRINLSYSLAKKVQYNFANRLFESRGLEDIVLAKYDRGMVNHKVYWPMLEASSYKTRLLESECNFTQTITVNGMIFASGLWLPDFIENRKVHEIFDIIVIEPKNVSDIFAVCKTYDEITENEHYCTYSVKKDSVRKNLSLINIKNFLSEHHYPVKAHNIGGNLLFRCKRF